MRDPFTWSFPLGQLFGITIRVHLLLPLVIVGLVARVAFDDKAIPGTWIDAAMLMGLLCISVLLHEFGHCFCVVCCTNIWPFRGLSVECSDLLINRPEPTHLHFLLAAWLVR